MNKSSTSLLLDTSISKVTNKVFLIFWLYIINLGLVNIINLVKVLCYLFLNICTNTPIGLIDYVYDYVEKRQKKENQMVLIDIF